MLDQVFLSLKRVFFSHVLENFPKQAISPNLHISLTVGTLSQAPLMIVQSQCCFSICLYWFRSFGLHAWENKNLVLGKTGEGSLLTGKFFHVGGKIFFQMGRMSKFLAGCIPSPPQCGKVYQPPHFFFHLPPFLIPSYLQKHATHPPLDTHHRKIPDSMMIHQNQGD